MAKECTLLPASLDSEDFEEYPFLASILWDKIKYDNLAEVDLTGSKKGEKIAKRKKLQRLHKEDKERERQARRIE